jgi:hypothetical protein
MNITGMWIAASLAACLMSGFAGASFAAWFLAKKGPSSLQVAKLELTDTRRRVRAVLSAEHGAVSLRMLSTDESPILELGIKDESEPRAQFVIYGRGGKPSITLATRERDRGTLAFSSENTPSQVSVGYSRVGDVDDGHDLGAWGVHISGPEHTSRGLFVFSKDGKLTGFTSPLEAPRSLLAK